MNLTDGSGYIIINNKLWYHGYYKLDQDGKIVKTWKKGFVPVKSDEDEDFIFANKGQRDSVFLTVDGRVYYIGEYPGHGVPTIKNKLTRIKIDKKVIAVSGESTCLLLTSDGEVYGCGNNADYEIKNNGSGRYFDPIKITGLPERIKSIRSVFCLSIFLGASGIVYIMGKGSSTWDKIGIDFGEYSERCGPGVVPIMKNIVKIETQWSDLAMINNEGKIYILRTSKNRDFDFPFLEPYINDGNVKGIYELNLPHQVKKVEFNGPSLIILTSDQELYKVFKKNSEDLITLLCTDVIDFEEHFTNVLVLSLDQKLYSCDFSGNKSVCEIENPSVNGNILLSEDLFCDSSRRIKRAETRR